MTEATNMWAYQTRVGAPTISMGSTIQMGGSPRVSSRSTNSRVASVGTKSCGETLKNLKRHKHKQLKEWCQHSRVSRRAFQCPSAGILNRISSDSCYMLGILANGSNENM